MAATALKNKIYKVIEDEQFLEAVFTILNNNSQNFNYELSEEDIKVIEDRKSAYKSGRSKSYSVSSVKKKILKNLGK